MVQFDDFGGFEVFRGLGGKVVGQYGGDREVRCDEDLLGFGLRTVGDGGFDLGEFLVGPAGGADHHVHALADQGQHVVQADGRHGEFDDHIGVVGGDLGQVVAGIQCERQLRILGVVHRFDHVQAHAALAPTTETLIMSSSLSTRTCPAMYPGRFPIGNQPITAKPSRQYPVHRIKLPLTSRTVKSSSL